MVKKVLFLLVGLGMITAGVAGITTSVIDQRHQVALKQLEGIQEQARLAAAQEQKRIEEKRQEMEQLAKTVQEEKQRVEDVRRRIEDERRRVEEARRATLAAVQEQQRAAKAATAAAPKALAKDKGSVKRQKSTVLAKKPQRPVNEGKSAAAPRRSQDLTASRQNTQDEAITRMSRKVGLEAARMQEPVQYINNRTGEVIVAEPVGSGPDSVRVRIRVWRNQRLVKERLLNFSEATLDASPRRSGWGWNGAELAPGRSSANHI